MFVYDKFVDIYNTMITQGVISHIGVQSMEIIYWSIVAYAPINLLFASAGALLAGNARSEGNIYAQTDIGSHILLGVAIIAAFLFDFFICMVLDPFIITLSPGDYFGSAGIMGNIFDACHLLCPIAVGIMYLYMMLKSIRNETWERGVPI